MKLWRLVVTLALLFVACLTVSLSAQAPDATASRLARRAIGSALVANPGPGGFSLGYYRCVDCDWPELPLDAQAALLLRGKSKDLDLYLDFAAAQLNMRDAAYWRVALPNWADDDAADVKARSVAEETDAIILEAIAKNAAVLQDIVSIRATLRGSPKFQRLLTLSEQLARTLSEELRTQPALAVRFGNQPKLPRLVQARRAITLLITK